MLAASIVVTDKCSLVSLSILHDIIPKIGTWLQFFMTGKLQLAGGSGIVHYF